MDAQYNASVAATRTLSPAHRPGQDASVQPRPEDHGDRHDDDIFRVLVTCSVFEPGFRAGGPVRSLAHLLDTVSPRTEVVLVTGDRDLGAAEPYPGLSGRWVCRGAARLFYLGATRPGHWARLWRSLRQHRFDVLYVTSLWSPYSLVPIVAARLRLIHAPLILVAPNGELSEGALALKSHRKCYFLWWWSRFLRHGDVLWHATSPGEEACIRRMIPWAQVEVFADQSPLPPEPMLPSVSQAMARLVFIGRISPMKNVTTLLMALAQVTVPMEFDLYGPVGDVDYWSRCQQLIAGLPPHVRFRYLGELRPEQVRSTFAAYDAFVFPTLGESFGHVIAESLSASCPVLCSDNTPWSELLASGGGAVVTTELTPARLAAEMDRIAAMPPAARMAARHQAGGTYRHWWAASDRRNILEQLRLRYVSSARSGQAC